MVDFANDKSLPKSTVLIKNFLKKKEKKMKKIILVCILVIFSAALTGCGAKMNIRDAAVSAQSVAIYCHSKELQLSALAAGIYREEKMGRIISAQNLLVQYSKILNQNSEICGVLTAKIWETIVFKKQEEEQ